MKYLSKEPLVMPVGSKASEETWERVFSKKTVQWPEYAVEGDPRARHKQLWGFPMTDAVGSEKCKATLEVNHNG